MSPVARHVKPRVLEALGDTRIVVVQGARQVGKTTLVREIVGAKGGRLESFDDRLTARAASEDPIGFLSAAPDRLLAIDEVQRVPELILALKYVVDRDTRPGRFLVTGSANLLKLPAIEDSLAGRTESIELHGFSQGEIAGHAERFVDRLLTGERFADHRSDLHRRDYLERAVAGGYPEALTRTPGRRRDLWLDNYVNGIVRREADDVSNLQRIAELPLILRVLAARNSGELIVADVARETEIPARTLTPYLELLQTLYLTQHVPAWATNLAKRVVSRPKVSLLDSGLAARLINVSAQGASPDGNPHVAGGLLEGFVAGEIRRQLTWSEETARIGHFREQSAGEVDLVLETPDGRVAGIEVKSTAAPKAKDAKGLAYLRDRLGKRFVAGVILHTGTTAGAFGDRIAAVPMDVLWTT
ncbi:hypothetical protein MLP_05470 [Microlunatus phosphovorus NM-1]|uniref:AAA+ ATPase domain-containing protein n=1 Tax=Microlunatus phosphovorus (strain ATCC 700054 / DSM 10555 / JCM 9379 / NBRC 101784 / NCIMB 13414 / VKM Ac-1990 / NM-1) TaxID=1032480 RepID=F5XK65_MICPN|nr:ATP-binding protein [Microlunatus phosphovorus]BAK33561.1 hypothetical protein MLP_05470 [Microlunatus phosphovorus NM-1]